MSIHRESLEVSTRGRGLIEITRLVAEVVSHADPRDGLVSVFCMHTSCSLVLMENADPTARLDLERYLNRLVPDGDRNYTHDAEGPDDMSAHIKMALTRTSESIPIAQGRMLLGTWQGLFLWEHRATPHRRSLQITVLGQ